MIRPVLGLAALHFAVAFLVAFLTYGSDLDRLRSRSALSRGAGVAYDVLWFPHDLLLHSLPHAWLVAQPAAVTISLVGSGSLLWGLALHLGWRLLRAHRRATGR